VSAYAEQLAGAVRAVTFHSPTTFAWFGARSPRLPPGVRRALTPATARNYLRYQLQFQLYHNFYCAGGARPAPGAPAGPGLGGMTPFVAQLAAANSGAGAWDPGWQLVTVEADAVVVAQDGLALWVPPGEYRPGPGAPAGLRLPKDLLGVSPGFYMALSNAPLTPRDHEELVRLYWHVTAPAAVTLMALVTGALNAAGLPFKLKVVNDPGRFTRCDGAVLYLRRQDYPVVQPIAEAIYGQVRDGLRPGVPALTRPLAPGLGLAEDPGQGASFGMHRCLLLAESLLRAREAGCHRPAARLRLVLDQFAAAGVRPDAPYLRPGAPDAYTFTPPAGGAVAPAPRPPAAERPSFLDTAAALGRRLTDEAIWHAGRCNWIGAAPPEQRPGTARVYQALGPDLYGGTAGVALFLAELWAVTGDAAARRTALGAIRHALAGADRLPPEACLGLYTGWAGLALAAARVGLLLDVAEPVAGAHALARRIGPGMAGTEHDLLAGEAGALVGLLALAELLADPALLAAAAWLGDALLAAAVRSAAGWSWPVRALRRRHNLTGLAHGAAGIGFALLELAEATGDPGYRQAAEQAYAYERSWFDPAAGNWADLRQTGSRRRPPAGVTYWCHGAPGIALTRLRAYELLGEPCYRAEAATALTTTRQAASAALAVPGHDFSLCHGLAGMIEVLRAGLPALEPAGASATVALARAVAAAGQARYGEPGATWPCGAGGGETPGLFLGLAGIGLFYLRQHHPATPPVVLVRRGLWPRPD
jgi:hypothetical protein